MAVGMMMGIVFDHVVVGMVVGLCAGSAVGNLPSRGAWRDEFSDDVCESEDEFDP